MECPARDAPATRGAGPKEGPEEIGAATQPRLLGAFPRLARIATRAAVSSADEPASEQGLDSLGLARPGEEISLRRVAVERA